MTNSLPTCTQCQSSIPADAPQGLCPGCVLLGVAAPTYKLDTATGSPPTVEDVAAAFPELEVLELIGQGGMGLVFKARQPRLDRLVALKILLPSLAAHPGFAERFTREARVLARLAHPHIVTIHDFGESAGFFYLIMEYVNGVNLRAAMRAGVKPEQALLLVPRICEALQFAHDHGVLHRDIKPENILLDTHGSPKLADFGIAKLAGEANEATGLTGTGSALGTAAYMAPEQVEKPATVDHRADIYSLGVVFYEMLTGELPLGRFGAPSAKSCVNPSIDEVVMRALEKERERRQQSATEMKTELTSAASPGAAGRIPGGNSAAPAPSTSSRARDFLRPFATETHRKIVAALHIGLGVFSILSSLLILLGFGGVLMMGGSSFFDGDMGMVTGFGGMMMVLMLASMFLLSVAGIIGGWGLYRGRDWGRYVLLVVGFLDLMNLPLGTLLGIYTLLVLLKKPEPPPLPNQTTSAA